MGAELNRWLGHRRAPGLGLCSHLALEPLKIPEISGRRGLRACFPTFALLFTEAPPSSRRPREATWGCRSRSLLIRGQTARGQGALVPNWTEEAVLGPWRSRGGQLKRGLTQPLAQGT